MKEPNAGANAGDTPIGSYPRSPLHVIETSGPGGAETVFVAVARRAQAVGAHPVVGLPDEGWVATQLTAAGMKPRYFPVDRRQRLPLDVGLVRWLVRTIREHECALVHAHCAGMSFYAALTSVLTGVPMVATLHGLEDVIGAGGRAHRLKLALLGRVARRIVVVSDSMRHALLATRVVPASKIVVVHNGIDAEAFAAIRAAKSPEPVRDGAREFTVGALGNIRPAKAYDVLLEAMAMARVDAPHLRLAIAGEGQGSLLDELLALRDRLGLQDVVRFAGFQPDPAAYLSTVDAFVLSSRTEGFSLATVQAMAAGLAVVATRSGGPEEIVTAGVDGLLVPAGDPVALAREIVRVAADARLREQLGHAARQTAATRFSIGRMLSDYERLYAEMRR